MTQQVDAAKRVKELVLDGFCIEYRALSICLITDYYKHKGLLDYAFQVHVDHYRLGTVSEIHESIDKSVARFFELKRKCYGRHK